MNADKAFIFFGAEGGTWTHTLSPTMDFESIASAIPPLRRDFESFIIIIDTQKKSKRFLWIFWKIFQLFYSFYDFCFLSRYF